MPAKDADWSIFYTSFIIAAVLGGALVITCWGGYGAGLATATFGFLVTIAAMLSCCCSKQQCLDRWPCQCCSCADCNELKTIFHARNLIVIAGIFALLGSIAVLVVSLVMTFSEDCKDSHCHSIRSNKCKQCWDPSWTAHPWKRWEWGLSEMCWASDLGQDIFDHNDDHDHDISFGCHWYWDEEHEHEDGDDYKVIGPSNNDGCKKLCKCMGGDYEECGNDLRFFGVAGLANGLFGICFVIASFCACMAAGRIIHDSGGPQAVGMQFAAPPMTGQVVGQPVGTPVVVAVAPVVQNNDCSS